jgi:hypothetical protein
LKILIDITHPAHVHFFRNSIQAFESSGHEILITSRSKDLAIPLLDAYGLNHSVLTRSGTSLGGLAGEFAIRCAKLVRIIRRERPDILAAVAGTFIAPAGKMTGTPVITFYDTEIASVSNFIAYRLSDLVVVPSCYRNPVPYHHITYPGYHELAYLHPDVFSPDPSVPAKLGVSNGERYAIVRFVSWKSGHDIGRTGLSLSMKRATVRMFSEYARVFISSEKPLPKDLEPYRFPLPPVKIHDALQYASLYYGESATMASESVVLGTPSVYLDNVGRGYTDEQEKVYEALFRYPLTPHGLERSVQTGIELLRTTTVKELWGEKRRKILTDKINVTPFIVSTVTEAIHRLRGAG